MRHFGFFSARVPTYIVARHLHKRGHQNVILNNDYVAKSDESKFEFIRNIGRNYWEKFYIVTKILSSLDYDVVFAYDTSDAMSSVASPFIKTILYALRSKRKRKPKVIYYNLELFVLDYKSHLKRILGKSLEQVFIFGCDAFVALSPTRLHLAEKIFKITCKKFVIPNSFDFEAKEIRKKPNEPFKLIYTGGIEKFFFDQIDKVSGSFEFTIHGASRYKTETLKDRIKKGKSIILSEKIIEDYDEFNRFVEKHDAGFVWYLDTRLNDKFAGWSSTKYFRYLSLGKPVIVRNLPELAETTIQNNFGVIIDDFSEIGEAVEKIKYKYQEYVEGILENYHKFEFSRNFEKLYDFIIS
ncbi:MAG: hypothetical protein NZ927_08265 [Candidatus Calescibacterium sp.]|nr:hypothetical protein [Candidatus Calescibacterium sp.]MCX7734214.1 hypothetical protein [bacterium]MDW8087928.1 hypothetical protein [Candidatus Calescibacterium sp.]